MDVATVRSDWLAKSLFFFLYSLEVSISTTAILAFWLKLRDTNRDKINMLY